MVALRAKMTTTQQRAANVLANISLPQLPTRNEIFDRATAIFTKTSSMDDIVDMAYILILDTIGGELSPPSKRITAVDAGSLNSAGRHRTRHCGNEFMGRFLMHILARGASIAFATTDRCSRTVGSYLVKPGRAVPV